MAQRSASSGSAQSARILRFPERPALPVPAAFGLLRSYWDGLREDGALPRRSAVDPRGLVPVLDVALLIERIAPGHARIRVAGSRIADLMDMELRGMPLSVLFEPAAREALAIRLEQLFVRPAILEMGLEAAQGAFRPSLSGQMLLLPLSGEDGTVDRAIGCIAIEGRIGRVPRRLAISTDRLSPVPGMLRAGQGSPVRPAEDRFRETGRAPWLRLVGRSD
ncbi:MAG: PAS domain-containing protein [Gemmobacter sp.]